MATRAISPDQFSTFGDLLKYLRRREELTQRELALKVGYSDTQISRIEQNQRVPDTATILGLFVPVLRLNREAEWASRMLDLARQARQGELPESKSAPSTAPNNLPALLTTFIGREKEQEEIIQLLDAHRLLTLTGSGGVGKTRLSLEVGKQVLGAFRHGVWLVELASLDDPGLLAQTVAAVIGIDAQADTPSDQLLINFLHKKSALLILDNCEHLLNACAALVDALLKNCSQLRILATSREALSILGESQYRLPSLGLPDSQQTPDNFRESESVRLFEERAQLAQSDFELTLENAASVAQICSQLDGIPLAIELAAARVNIFSTAQIAARLENCFDLLTGGSRTALPRQRTLRASIDWSWNLISDSERILLRRLVVFKGGWTLKAAEAVCSITGIEVQQVLGLMSQLVAKSLVIVNGKPGCERRFNLHETIQKYALEKLVEAGEEGTIRNLHLKYFLEHSAQIESGLYGSQYTAWLAEANDERDNIRAALEHASRVNVEAGLFISGRLQDFWEIFDQREGYSWLTRFIQKSQAKDYPRAKARALLALGSLLPCFQQFSKVYPIGQECLTLYRACGDLQGEADVLIVLGYALQHLDEQESAIEHYEQALKLSRSLGDVRRQALALFRLGWDRPAVQLAYWDQAIDLFREADDHNSLASLLYLTARYHILSTGDIEKPQKYIEEASRLIPLTSKNRRGSVGVYAGWVNSMIALMRGEYEDAYTHLQEVMEFSEDSGDRASYLWSRAYLGNVALRAGNLVEACQIFTETAQIFQGYKKTVGVTYALEGLVGVYAAVGKPELAARLIGWADAARARISNPRPFLEQANVDKGVASIGYSIGVSAYQAAYESGREMTLDEAVACTLVQNDQV